MSSFGPCGDEVGHHRDALGVIEDEHLDAVLGQPLVTAEERRGLPDDDARDAELPHEPRAVPAR
jgi:hypothetical protein